MAEIRFDERVAIITGAGGGLGKSHALLLASRGAKVVVNDLGGSADGTGKGSTAADKVVEEIKAAGGEAVANYDSVSDPEGAKNIVKTALDAFGKVDILINNAGILRDKTLLKMEDGDWDIIFNVHVKGAYYLCKQVLPIMREQAYGRIIMTTSAAGLYGNFGQTNYGAAKMALVGFMNVLKEEGKKYNIFVNTIAPIAASRLTQSLLPPPMMEKLQPEFVSPLVAYLCSEDCKDSGMIFDVAGGHIARIAIVEAPGVYLDVSQGLSIEAVRDSIDQAKNLEGAKPYPNLQSAIPKLIKK